MKQASKLLLISAGCLSISACSGTQLVSYSIIQQSNQCHIQAPSITPLSSQEEQITFIEKYGLFKTSDSKQVLTNLFKEHSQNESLFIVAQGSKPSTGYGFRINGLIATLDGEQLTLPIMFTSPNQGSFTAQVMTSPCLVLGIDSEANYRSVIIDDLEINLTP